MSVSCRNVHHRLECPPSARHGHAVCRSMHSRKFIVFSSLILFQSKRRFWVLAVVVMTSTGAIASLASLILHYTKIGDDEYGCKGETLMMSGKLNTNLYCTREMAACRFLKKNLPATHQPNLTTACNETVRAAPAQLLGNATYTRTGRCQMATIASRLKCSCCTRHVLSSSAHP